MGKLESGIDSDHKLIISHINARDLQSCARPSNHQHKRIVSSKITLDQILGILLDVQWPGRPFMELAEERNLMVTHKIKHAPYEEAKKLIKRFSKLEEQLKFH